MKKSNKKVPFFVRWAAGIVCKWLARNEGNKTYYVSGRVDLMYDEETALIKARRSEVITEILHNCGMEYSVTDVENKYHLNPNEGRFFYSHFSEDTKSYRMSG